MNIFSKFFLTTAISSLLLTGCGGGGSGGSGDSGGSGTNISGMASAPSGSVAQTSAASLFQIAASIIISPAQAAITGLQPVTGATVELIRVDNDGNQIGAVLATTSTSITGNYTLTLPQGVNLAGDLVVRITGNGGAEMRAQVVAVSVDITPVSEFVLQKYIANDADLDSLEVTDVVKLRGNVEQFDLTAGADLAEMLATLENEVGDFVDNTVASDAATTGDVSTIAGNYRSSAFALGLHDGDANLYGSVAVDIYQSDLNFADGGNGEVDITRLGEESAYMQISGTEADAYFYNDVIIDDESDTFTGPFAADGNGTLSILGEFDENINIFGGDCCGWRSPPSLYRLQKVSGRGLFFLAGEDVLVRYSLTDTNNDGTPDAINPNDRSGDEAERSLEVFARKPTAMTAANLNGDFGRVWMGTSLASATVQVELETETNILTFGGDGTFDYGPVATHHILSRNEYVAEAEPAETDLTVVTTADGDITSIAGAEVDGFIDDSYSFMTFADTSTTAANGEGFGRSSKTLMMKLGAGIPTVTGNVYRVMSLGMQLSGDLIAVDYSRFDSTLTMNSESVGSLSLKTSVVQKDNLGSNLEVTNNEAQTFAAAASIGNKGAATIAVNDGNGINTMEGFFNADASLGIFRLTSYAPNEANPNMLGLVVLVKIN